MSKRKRHQKQWKLLLLLLHNNKKFSEEMAVLPKKCFANPMTAAVETCVVLN
jgi:hypothetical protein